MWEAIKKNIASGILTTIAIGLITVFGGMFVEVKELRASDHNLKFQFDYAIRELGRRLERIEKKNDKIIEKLMEIE